MFIVGTSETDLHLRLPHTTLTLLAPPCFVPNAAAVPLCLCFFLFLQCRATVARSPHSERASMPGGARCTTAPSIAEKRGNTRELDCLSMFSCLVTFACFVFIIQVNTVMP